MPFYSFFYSFLGENKIIAASVSILLLVGEAILLNVTVSKFHLIKGQNYLPALIYVFLMCSLPEILFLHPVLFANLFLIFAIKRCFDLLGSANASSVAFDSAFFVSLGSLFYFPAIVFLLLILIALFAFRPFSLRNWLIAVLGISIPYLFAAVYFYWFDESRHFWIELILQPIINKSISAFSFLKSFYALIIFLVLLIMFSIPPLLIEMRRNKASIRSGLRLFIWFGVLSILSFVIAPGNILYHFCFAAIPLSIIFSTFFINIKSVLAESIFSFFILLIVIYQLNYF